jgi:serine/threonine protein kinase
MPMTAGPDVLDEDLPRAFGKYLLLQNFARGGMGEVYLARSGGIAGLERVCVLKKLRADMMRDREYVTRFVDEARVVVTLNHANICNVFDVGRVDAEYYLAMEYVSGRDVRALQERCRERALVAPPLAALHIVCEVLEALDYAHRRHHPVTQEPLQLVHRDISPQNVLVSYEGEVKLIDFGLAASRLKVERTQPNVVMGKMAYMPPEQARGDPIDARADLFACGVLAYELLTNERYYEGMTASDIWQVAGRGGFMPRAWGSLDPVLTPLLARALHPEARRRYPSCGEFRDALQTFMRERLAGNAERSVRQLMEQLFEDEILRERAALARYGAVTVAAIRTATEQTKSQSVSFAGRSSGDDPPTAENASIDASATPIPAGRSTEEGSPLSVARTAPHDDPTRLDQERPTPSSTKPPTDPSRSREPPATADEPPASARGPLPATDPPSLGARSRARPVASPSTAPPGRVANAPSPPVVTGPPRGSGGPAPSSTTTPPRAPAGVAATPRSAAAGAPTTAPPRTPTTAPPRVPRSAVAAEGTQRVPRRPRATAGHRLPDEDPVAVRARQEAPDDATLRHRRDAHEDQTVRHVVEDVTVLDAGGRPWRAIAAAAMAAGVLVVVAATLLPRAGGDDGAATPATGAEAGPTVPGPSEPADSGRDARASAAAALGRAEGEPAPGPDSAREAPASVTGPARAAAAPRGNGLRPALAAPDRAPSPPTAPSAPSPPPPASVLAPLPPALRGVQAERQLRRLEERAAGAPCVVALVRRARIAGEPYERLAGDIDACARAEGVTR